MSDFKKLAQQANVSTATISRVINNPEKVSKKTRDKVLQVMREQNYLYNPLPKNLKNNSSRTIAFISPELGNIFFMEIARIISIQLKQLGYTLIISSSDNDSKMEQERIKEMMIQRVDAIILITVGDIGQNYREILAKDYPLILLDRKLSKTSAISITVDDEEVASQVLEKNVMGKRKKLGFIGGRNSLSNAVARYQGFRKYLLKYDIPCDERLIQFGDFDIESGYTLMEKIDCFEYDYVFVANYYSFLGALKYLLEKNSYEQAITKIFCFDHLELMDILHFKSYQYIFPTQELADKTVKIISCLLSKEDDYPLEKDIIVKPTI